MRAPGCRRPARVHGPVLRPASHPAAHPRAVGSQRGRRWGAGPAARRLGCGLRVGVVGGRCQGRAPQSKGVSRNGRTNGNHHRHPQPLAQPPPPHQGVLAPPLLLLMRRLLRLRVRPMVGSLTIAGCWLHHHHSCVGVGQAHKCYGLTAPHPAQAFSNKDMGCALAPWCYMRSSTHHAPLPREPVVGAPHFQPVLVAGMEGPDCLHLLRRSHGVYTSTGSAVALCCMGQGLAVAVWPALCSATHLAPCFPLEALVPNP